MKSLSLNLAANLAIGLCAMLFYPRLAHAQTASPSPKEAIVTNHATGPFDVKTIPAEDKSDDPLLGRTMLDKQYHGDLDATAKGQMLTAIPPSRDLQPTLPSKRLPELYTAAAEASCCNTPEP
jgi:hypothetical protein